MGEHTPVSREPQEGLGRAAQTHAECPHCGAKFSKLREGKVPTHDFPPPCRSVCPGSKQEPRERDDPLWKDNPAARVASERRKIRLELVVYGFAAVKHLADVSGEQSGTMECPLCQKQLRFSVAKSNGHLSARCETPNCINAME